MPTKNPAKTQQKPKNQNFQNWVFANPDLNHRFPLKWGLLRNLTKFFIHHKCNFEPTNL